jgi:hypothetical protein
LTVSAIRETVTAVGFGDVPIVNYLQLQIERDGEVMFRAIESLASDSFVHQAPSIKKNWIRFQHRQA